MLVEAGDFIPVDGEVDRRRRVGGRVGHHRRVRPGHPRERRRPLQSVTGGTRVLSDWLVVRIGVNPGETFLDRMIAMVEGAKRQKTPNEIALNILLAALTIIFLLATVTLLPFSHLQRATPPGRARRSRSRCWCALLVCLIPTTIGGLLSAIGIAGHGPDDPGERDRDERPGGRGGGRRGRAAARQDRHDHARQPRRRSRSTRPMGRSEREVADAAQLSSLADETPEGRSIVVLAKEKYGIRERQVHELDAHFVPFTAQTRMSGVELRPPGDPQGRGRRDRGVRRSARAGSFPRRCAATVDAISKQGGTPLVVASGARRARRDRAEGHRQGRHEGAVRRAAADGHQDGHDHRRQPADRRRHRRRGGRGRLPRPGHAGDEAEADPRVSGGRPARRDDRRRHERRARRWRRPTWPSR